MHKGTIAPHWAQFIRGEVVESKGEVNNTKRYMVEDEETKKHFTLILDDCWHQTDLRVGEIIHIIFLEERFTYILPDTISLTNTSPLLLIEYPDVMINTTGVVNSMFCNRKTIISGYVYSDESIEAAEIGTVIHESVQHVIITDMKEFNRQIFRELVEEITDERLTKVYCLGLTREQFIVRAMEFYNSVNDWFTCWRKHCVETQKRELPVKELVAAEAQLQSYIFGFKGSIDILLKNDEGEVLVEMKTGKAKPENEAQVTFYFLLLSGFLEKQYHQFSGLLNYVHKDENRFEQVQPTLPNLGNIARLRNELAVYMVDSRIPNEMQISKTEVACRYCAFTKHCALVCLNDGIDFGRDEISHLSDRERQFYMKYLKIMRSEIRRVDEENVKRWTTPDDAPALSRKAKLTKRELTKKRPDYYIYTFEGDITYYEGLTCVSSEDGKINIVKGYMMPPEEKDWKVEKEVVVIDDDSEAATQDTIEIVGKSEKVLGTVLKRVRIRTPQRMFYDKDVGYRLDRFIGNNSLMSTMNMIGKLMEDSDEMKRIRDLIINNVSCPVVQFAESLISQKTTIMTNIDEDEFGWVFDQINIDQHEPVIKTYDQMNEFLVGTLAGSHNITPILGLTPEMAITAIVGFCRGTTKRVFVTASSSDLLNRIKEKLPPERTMLYSDMDALLKENKVIEDVIENHPYVLAPCSSATRKFIQSLQFDVAIIADAINFNVIQALAVFYLTETVWLFEGAKTTQLDEGEALDKQSVYTVFSGKSKYSLSAILDKEVAESLKAQTLDIEDLGFNSTELNDLCN
ncbi:DNA replication helicase DNA2, putative [Entamoeba invadens IP1]|uniref:DNA replication helicase DNA2, putative n=1 Tax=Entamoeba invadens IP1 TaxID=370355 RepID=A0A0A1TZB3_ENTIV|nr:DNA replication helicase DNA2, putative [Entamoeba invadens IP1]ELP83856.1 DNA replication helicase DNA2, putative [Entamoeba invadens IP1]|eukprot:XP_004183202.1 DNA replication helicase DNA2, putative [Entamoeba invadens IP1]